MNRHRALAASLYAPASESRAARRRRRGGTAALAADARRATHQQAKADGTRLRWCCMFRP